MLKRYVCLLLLAIPVTTASQTPARLSFSATLDSIKVHARPSEVVTRQFRLTLDADQPRTRFRVKVEDFWRSEDGRQSFYAPVGTLRRSCGPWVSVNPVESLVEPGETLVVRATVSVPREVAEGGFWCVLTVDELPDPEAAASGVGVRFLASVSTGVFVNIGEIERAASILDLGVEGEAVRVRARNEGNVPLGIEGRVEWRRAEADELVAAIVLPRTTVFTEPTREGVIVAPLPPVGVLPSGAYLVRTVLDFGGDHFVGAERELEILRPDHAKPGGR